MSLTPLRLKPFTSKELKPTGWLLKQLQIQADGLNGNLDKVWPDIKDSKWLGGDRDGWERIPYWLDGFIPLAYLLGNGDMIARAKQYINVIIENQKPDGWICPCEDSERSHYDVWPIFLICKVLTVYHDCSDDERIEGVVRKVLLQLKCHLRECTLFNWGAARWFEALIPIFWLYDRTEEEWLITLARTLYVEGFEYEKIFDDSIYKEPQKEWSYLAHVVNMAMCLKSKALMTRILGGDASRFAREMTTILARYHGTAYGHFTGDECLAGTSPTQGSELCGIVEAMYSYEHLLQISGSYEWADYLEILTFNGLPATISPDMWTHQYDQLTNQIESSRIPEKEVPFTTNNGESHLFGLEPNFGCCTANFGQGWPKFALSTFMRTPTGIAAIVLAPSKLRTIVDDVPVFCELETQYPFRDKLTFTIETQNEVFFDFLIRIPEFVTHAWVDGKKVLTGQYHTISRIWSGSQTIEVKFQFETEMISRPNNMVSIKRGPLLYALPIHERWEKWEYVTNGVERKFPYCDYQIFPTSKWNYAFVDSSFTVEENDDFDAPFSTINPPIVLYTSMAEIPWSSKNGICNPQPDEMNFISVPQRKKLIPYGCTNLRMAEMPYIHYQK